ncbi:MAG: hypothetical protein IT350_05670 [Deltaproteobacteria bacterium]|nr:hypothetical protein [Deltaproteobacteria bacterium]
MRIVLALVVASSLVVPALAFAQAVSPQGPQVVLQVEEKDPAHARAMALWPIFGPIAGANYAGSSPDSGNIPESLKRTARTYALANTGEILGIAALGYFVGQGTESEDKKIVTEADGSKKQVTEEDHNGRWIGLGVGAGVGLIVATITNTGAGAKYADYCVRYNRKLYEKFQWTPPQVSVGPNGETSVAPAVRFR